MKQSRLQAFAFASQLLPAVIGVLSFMLLVRMVAQQVLGEYMMYMAAVVLFEMVKSGGLQSALVMRLSGAGATRQRQIKGSAYWLGFLISGAISLVLGVLYFLGVFSKQPGIQVFCGWYACLGLLTLPVHIAEATAVAKQKLRFLLVLRLSQSVNSILIALYAYAFGGSLQQFASVHLCFTALLVTVVLFSGMSNPRDIRYRTLNEIKEIIRLIRYTLATLATTNVLKSADTFLIGSFMGSNAVAAYAIPLKLTELFEIPLRSLSTTAFPQLASSYNQKRLTHFRELFVQYLSWAYLLYIPALVIAFVFAPLLVIIIGGHQYAETANVFRVFVVYGLILPADRLSGISLDAIQKPGMNFTKVIFMAIVNIAGDVAAVYFSNSLEWVAFASVLNAATGAVLGWWLLNRTGVMGSGGYMKACSECMVYSSTFIKKNITSFIKAA